MKTTDATSEVERFYLAKKRWLKETPLLEGEDNTFFMKLYVQTYPARTFPLTLELLNHYERQQDERRQDDAQPIDDKNQSNDPQRGT